MAKYNILSPNSGYWLHFLLREPLQWVDVGLPPPHYYLEGTSGNDRQIAFAAWRIDGYFGTKKGVEYLNDVIARFLLTLDAERLPYRPYYEERKESARLYDVEPYKLSEIASYLDSLPRRKQIPRRADNYHDYTFWAIKFWVEDQIAANGEGTMVVYETLENWAMGQFLGHKERSTIRAKCRSIWNWYDERGWTIPDTRKGKVSTMSRTEAATNAAKSKAEQARQKIIDAMNSVIAADLKKKNGKWNAKKIAEVTGLHPETVRKHLKELTENA